MFYYFTYWIFTNIKSGYYGLNNVLSVTNGFKSFSQIKLRLFPSNKIYCEQMIADIQINKPSDTRKGFGVKQQFFSDIDVDNLIKIKKFV